MIFNYTLTEEILFNFHKKYIVDSIQSKKYFFKTLMELAFIYLIMYIFVWNELKISIIIGFTGSSIIFSLFRKKFYLIYFKKNIFKSIYSYSNLSIFSTETLIKFNNIGIIIETPMNKKIIKWKYIINLYIIDNNVIIKSFSDYNIFIPSSAIDSKEKLEKLIGLFKENIVECPKYKYPKSMHLIL
ncbi:hypothetical protein CFSAN002368_23572 [Clostridium botulinum A1 str. CFSAN002368]|nr:hypothetical protein CFSAN002368_23572 [Clostridium botulinum A1 str. CFSAN002368]